MTLIAGIKLLITSLPFTAFSHTTNVNISSVTNISTNQTDSKTFIAAQKQLELVISRLNKRSSSDLINGLLTESERIMLIKRFGAIFLIHNQYSVYKTAQLLGLSQPTVQRFKELYDSGESNRLLSHITKTEQNELLTLFIDFTLSKASSKARKNLAKRIL